MYDAYSRFLTYYTDHEFLPRIQAFTPGDVLFFRYSDKDWTEAQRKATGSYYDHTEIYVGRGAVLQANWDGVNLKPLVYDRLKKKDEFKVFRPSGHRDAADLLEARIAQYVRSGVYARKAYLEALRGNNPKNAMGGGRLFTCASFVCRCLADASFSLDDEFDECWTPDELLRLLGRGQEVTELVYKSMDSSEKDAYSIFPMSFDHGNRWNITYNSRLKIALSNILKHPLLRRYFEGASLVFPNNPWEVNCNESHFSMLMTLALAPWRYDIYGVELGQIDDALVAILDPAITNRESWQSRSRLWRQMVHETYSHYYHLLERCDDIQAKDRNLLFDMLMDRLTCFLSTFKDCLDLAQQFQREVAALESPERLMPHAPKAARLLTTGLFDDGVVAGQFFLDALSALQSRIAGDDWSEAAIAQEVMAVHRSNTAREIRANVERRLSQFVRQSEKYLVSLTRRHFTDELDWIEPVVRYWVTP